MTMTSPRPARTTVGTSGRTADHGAPATSAGAVTNRRPLATVAMTATDMAAGIAGSALPAGTVSVRNDRTGMVARLTESLDRWHGRIDDLVVQADLGSMELRESVGDRMAHLVVAWEVARQRLWASATTVGRDADEVYRDVEDALADLKVAYAEVVAMLERR